MQSIEEIKRAMSLEKEMTISRLTEDLRRKQSEIDRLKETINHWKQRYIGACLSSWNEISEDDADHFAYTIKGMAC